MTQKPTYQSSRDGTLSSGFSGILASRFILSKITEAEILVNLGDEAPTKVLLHKS